MTEWLVFAALAVSLINTVMIISHNEKINKFDTVIQSLIMQAIILSELLELMEQEINGDD
jgi:uncharacterized membrane protein